MTFGVSKRHELVARGRAGGDIHDGPLICLKCFFNSLFSIFGYRVYVIGCPRFFLLLAWSAWAVACRNDIAIPLHR